METQEIPKIERSKSLSELYFLIEAARHGFFQLESIIIKNEHPFFHYTCTYYPISDEGVDKKIDIKRTFLEHKKDGENIGLKANSLQDKLLDKKIDTYCDDHGGDDPEYKSIWIRTIYINN